MNDFEKGVVTGVVLDEASSSDGCASCGCLLLGLFILFLIL